MSIDLRSLGFNIAAVAPLLIVVFFEKMISSALGRGVWALLFVAAMVCFFVFLYFYMRRLDEAAWAAQKSAWLWGGVAGIVIGILLAIVPTPFSDFISDAVARLAARAGDGSRGVFSPLDVAFHLGAAYICVAQSIGFFVAWIVWWARR